MKKLITLTISLAALLLLTLLFACSSGNHESLSSYLQFDWINAKGELIYRGNLNGPYVDMTMVDLNNDGIYEVIISQLYSQRYVRINDVYSFKNEEVFLVGSFFGDIVSEDNKLKVLCQDEQKYFITSGYTYQNLIAEEVFWICKFDDELSSIDSELVLSNNVYADGEKEFYSNDVTVEQHEYDEILRQYTEKTAYEKPMATHKNLVYNTFGDNDEWSTSAEEVREIILQLYDAIQKEK